MNREGEPPFVVATTVYVDGDPIDVRITEQGTHLTHLGEFRDREELNRYVRGVNAGPRNVPTPVVGREEIRS